MTAEATTTWPALPYDEWKDTYATLHLWTQVVGKVKLALTPFLNEWWSIGFEVSARGLTSGLIPYEDRTFEVDFDFIEHNLYVRSSDGGTKAMSLVPRSVADFYGHFMAVLSTLGIVVEINPVPVEIPNPVPFEQDEEHASYDPVYVNRWWRILLGTTRVLQRYRASFFGKSSPILFYWGSFDLTSTRFSGRPAPPMEGMPSFFQIAEDQENAACGFWPGGPTASGFTLGEPAFYAYTIPAPDGYQDARVRPDAAYYHQQLGEFILPYEAARLSDNPEGAILEFFRSTYEAGADLAGWDRPALETGLRPGASGRS